MSLTFMTGYQNNDNDRLSFNQLAHDTFGIDFETWYQMGCWEAIYTCYSYKDTDKIVVNLSTTEMALTIKGITYNALQIGTVMTHPDYRGQGYNGQLMRKALESHKEAELCFLFAHRDAVPYYEKYGFKAYKQYNYTLMKDANVGKHVGRRQLLNMKSEKDRSFVRNFYDRKHTTKLFDASKAGSILMWYCVNFYNGKIYYIEDLDTIVISECDGGSLELTAVISEKPYDLDRLLDYIVDEPIHKIVFEFTPDDALDYVREENEEAIYVRSEIDFDEFERYPTIATA